MTAPEQAEPAVADVRTGATPFEWRCTGSWILRAAPELERRLASLPLPEERELVIDATAVTAMDTAGAWLLHRTVHALESGGRSARLEGLRPEFAALLQLIGSRADALGTAPGRTAGTLERLGRGAREFLVQSLGLLSFIGESAAALARWVTRPRHVRWLPILHNLQSAGFEALPITGLLTFLLGIVIAYQGAEQLQRFGANIYVADLVGLSMVRELAPLITAIIVAGRSGSAYAAQIGTMKVTEEIGFLRRAITR